MVAAAAAGVWLMSADRTTPPSDPTTVARSDPPALRGPPPALSGTPASEPPAPGAGEGATTAAPEPAVPESTPAQVAFVEHARAAERQWRRSRRVLVHADPPAYADIAHQLAERLAAVTPTTPAPLRQELVVEERQFIEHLRRRYAGNPELMEVVDQLDADLQAFQDQVVHVGPSPDPRSGSGLGEPAHGD